MMIAAIKGRLSICSVKALTAVNDLATKPASCLVVVEKGYGYIDALNDTGYFNRCGLRIRAQALGDNCG